MTDRIGSIGKSQKVKAFAKKISAKKMSLTKERKRKREQIESGSKKILIKEREKRI